MTRMFGKNEATAWRVASSILAGEPYELRGTPGQVRAIQARADEIVAIVRAEVPATRRGADR